MACLYSVYFSLLLMLLSIGRCQFDDSCGDFLFFYLLTICMYTLIGYKDVLIILEMKYTSAFYGRAP